MSSRPLTAPARRSAKRWRSGLAAAALAALTTLPACAPRAAPLPGDLPAREPEVRVGLQVDTARVQIGSTAGLELVDPTTDRVLGTLAPGATVVVSAGADGTLELEGAAGLDDTGATLLSARPRGGGFLTLGGSPYRGTLLVRAAGAGRVTAVNEVDMEAYLLGVVPREIGKVGVELLEAAKAQAVAARTYAVRYLGRREALGFDVFATVQDQVYGGVEAEHDPVSRAVLETAGEILVHDGEPIEAFYHSTCAGQTAAIEEVWDEEPRPYLVSVVDVDPRTGEAFDRSSSRFEWTVRWSDEELEQILSRTLADSLPAGRTSIGELQDLSVLRTTPSGRVAALRIRTTTGDYVVGGDRVRWILRTPEDRLLNSSRFALAVQHDAEGEVREVVAQGGGWGHGIGMCQVGAMGRARAGQDYRAILRTYYPGTRLVELY